MIGFLKSLPSLTDIGTCVLIIVYIWQGKIELRVDLEKTWSYYLWTSVGRIGLEKQGNDRENRLAAKFCDPRTVS